VSAAERTLEDHVASASRRIVIAFPFVGDKLGGSHISATGLIAGLDKEKFEPLIVVHKQGQVLERFLQERGLSVTLAPEVDILSPLVGRRLIGGFSAALAHLRTTARLVRFLRTHSIDIVHTNDSEMHATWALAARLAGGKLLWHHRADPLAQGVNILAPLLANHIVGVSKFVRPARPLLPIEHKFTVLHSPFDHPGTQLDREACRRNLAEELLLPFNTRFVGYVGNLVERKRPMAFVEAVHAFHRRYPDFALSGVLFGCSPPNKPDLGEMIRTRANELGISNRIHLLGFRTPVAPCMSALDILLVPAVNEPFGRTLIEAMLLGTPVVATNHGGNPEAVDDGTTGYLVEPEKPDAFVAPMARLLLDRAHWDEISRTAMAHALIKYGNKAHIEGISRLYRNLVPSR
jgi:glycosyltransferase involved in cell wall biosynthesis